MQKPKSCMACNCLNINRTSCPSSTEVGAHFGAQVSMSMVQVSRPFPHLHQTMAKQCVLFLASGVLPDGVVACLFGYYRQKMTFTYSRHRSYSFGNIYSYKRPFEYKNESIRSFPNSRKTLSPLSDRFLYNSGPTGNSIVFSLSFLVNNSLQ